MIKSALIGFSGFVGGNIARQKKFTDYYNSKNIKDSKDKTYDLVVSAAGSSLVWKANLDPESDKKHIDRIIHSLKNIKSSYFVLISSIFVYPNPYDVNEDSIIDKKKLRHPYGKNRYILEEFVKKNFKKHIIVRLPNLFGPGLKKNFVFDLIHNNTLDFTHKNSKLQWYNITHLWKDIEIAIKNNITLINFAVEPLTCKEIAKYTLDFDFTTITKKPPINHDMHTKYTYLYGTKGQYLYTHKDILPELKTFINNEKVKL